MKKLLLLVAIFATTLLSAQTGGYWVQEFKAKHHTENEISEAFDKVYKDVKMNMGGVSIQKITAGSQNGMTHRFLLFYMLGVEVMGKSAINADKWDAFLSKMDNYIEELGPTYSGRIINWQFGDTTNKLSHIWDIKVKDPVKFKAAHDVCLKELQNEFAGRFVGFGTYDIGRPNGANYWIEISGKDGEDHLKLYDKLEKSAGFAKYLQNRGEVIDVKDFELKDFKTRSNFSKE
jgi:hypothetical protein